MDPQTVFCHNPVCPARGQVGKGNIGVHSQEDGRYICHVCNTTFAATKGTVFYRLRKSRELVVIVVTLLAHGCPVQAIVAAFGLDERTVLSWNERSNSLGTWDKYRQTRFGQRSKAALSGWLWRCKSAPGSGWAGCSVLVGIRR
jgi:transposase-like protein